MNTLIKKTAALALTMLITLFTPMAAYESGFEVDFETSEDSADCLTILKNSFDESKPLWTETHCGDTADRIISLFKAKGMLEQDKEASCDFPDFCNSAMGKTLSSTTGESEHRLFLINLCGKAHVFVVEKKSEENETHWKIFQSWQEEFTLAQWLNIKRWENEELKKYFVDFGTGRSISHEQFINFLQDELKLGRRKLQRFREHRLPVPDELKITSFNLKKS
jgi:hypothetical protein